MFTIEYEIIEGNFNDLENISHEKICYDFLLGNITLSYSDDKIVIAWGWIPLLDFADCLAEIARRLAPHLTAQDFFEFTENDEKLQFIKREDKLHIHSSFSEKILILTWNEFKREIDDFHFRISEEVRKNVVGKISNDLLKYLSRYS